MDIIFNTAGGLALFLLSMSIMSNGLKVFMGSQLKLFLQKWTSNLFRGLLSGVLVTGLVQSSSAVTVATIGFVNAGILNLTQALAVIFGANIGTTVTGWLVSLLGLGFKIDTLAMPILAAGVLIKFASSRKKLSALGDALTGFALFFVGLSILQDSFSSFADSYGQALFYKDHSASLLLFIFAGFIATLLTQSSSAAIALILIAAGQNILSINAAASAIIGANIGTTSTAVFAALNATPNAKRVAMGHVIFNIIAGIVALSILPLLLWLTAELETISGYSHGAVASLALFHTVFNILGVIIVMPFIYKLSAFLSSLFKTEEEDLGTPKFIDNTVASTPALAVSALWQELQRLNELVCTLIAATLSEKKTSIKKTRQRSEAITSLGNYIQEFVTTVRMENMARDVSEELADMIRIARYLEESAGLAPEVDDLFNNESLKKHSKTAKSLSVLKEDLDTLINVFLKNDNHYEQAVINLDNFEKNYQNSKGEILRQAASKKISAELADQLLDRLSHTRRALEQLFKADKMFYQNRDLNKKTENSE
jgi:phosphate:Na+ symporter